MSTIIDAPSATKNKAGAWRPIAPDQRWSLGFTSDALANGRKCRTANLKGDCTHE